MESDDRPGTARAVTEGADSASRRVARPLFLLLLALYLLTASGHLYLADAWSSLRTAESLITRGQLDIPFDPMFGGKFGPDGRFYSKYGPGTVAHMVLPAFLGRRLDQAVRSKDAKTVAMGLPASFLNVPFSAMTAVFFFLTSRRLGHSMKSCLVATLALALGTMLWPYSKFDAIEPQLTLPMVLAFFVSLPGDRRGLALSGLILGWGLLVKPVAALAVPAFIIMIRLRPSRSRGRDIACFLIGPAAAGAFLLGYDWLRFGSVLETGYSYEVQGYTIPPLIGLYGLLFSAGKGLLFYCPALLLSLGGWVHFVRRHRPEGVFVIALFLVHLLFYSVQQNWDGDWCWGPRYLLPCVPFLMLLSLGLEDVPIGRMERVVFTVIGLVAMTVQILGVAVDPTQYVRWISANKTVLGDPLTKPEKVYIPLHSHHFNPDLSPIRGHWHLLAASWARHRGQTVSPMILYSSIEERSDRSGHHLEPILSLPTDPSSLGLDLWFPLFCVLVSGRPLLLLLLLIAFAINVVALVHGRRALFRALRLADSDSTPG